MGRKQTIWTEQFSVSSFLVDARRALSLSGILSLVQEMAWLHADHLGYGYAATKETGESWVVARQALRMTRFPKWGETVEVKTWLRPPGAVIVVRDFDFLVNGESVGQAACHWLTIDNITRRPRRNPFPSRADYFRREGHWSWEPTKLAVSQQLKLLETHQVRFSDLDMHAHVNNLRFAQWIVDSVPTERLLSETITRYETNFLAEAKPDDKVQLWGGTEGEGLSFEGRRDPGGELLFTARLGLWLDRDPIARS